MIEKYKTYAIILAGGRGERFGGSKPKQFSMLAGRMVIEHTINIFEKHAEIDSIIVVTLEEYIDTIYQLVISNQWGKVEKVLIGGESRQESSFIALQAISDAEAKVLLHDAARPFLSERIITDTINALNHTAAVDVAIASSDTVIHIDRDNYIFDIPKREYFLRGQTPQGFHLSMILNAHKKAVEEHFTDVTDDCGIIKHYDSSKIYVVQGDESNIKITHPIDLYLADKLFQLKTYALLQNQDMPYAQLEGKTGIIFGVSQGIGREIFSIAKMHKIKIFGFSRNNGVNIGVKKEVEDALQRVYEKTKRIDFVIVTAGILDKKPLMQFDENDILEHVNTNYIGAVNVAQAAFSYVKESKGHVLFFSSSSYTRGRAYYSVYSSLKAAIVNLTQALSEEWYDLGIHVNCLVPARTATNMRFKNFGKEPEEALLSPITVAREALKVVSSSVTGEVIEVKKS